MALLFLAADQAELGYIAWVPFITAIVVFLIVFAIAAKLIWPRIVAGLDERDRKIRQEIASAEEARENAKKLLQDYERNLTAAREEAGQMIAKARADARAVAEELRSRNDAELADLKARAMSEIESAKKTAIAELHAEAATIATAMAAKILQREISAIDQQKLVDDSLGELTGAGRG